MNIILLLLLHNCFYFESAGLTSKNRTRVCCDFFLYPPLTVFINMSFEIDYSVNPIVGRSIIEHLIHLHRQYPPLWDETNPYFKVRSVRKQIVKHIHSVLARKFPNLIFTKDDVQKKIEFQ